MAQIEGQVAQVSTKLTNEGFASKAPEDVVQKQRTRLAELQEESATLATQLDELG